MDCVFWGHVWRLRRHGTHTNSSFQRPLYVLYVTPVGLMHSSRDPQTSFSSNFFIKNGSHSTIHTFKNYFVTVFSVFNKISDIQTHPKWSEYELGRILISKKIKNKKRWVLSWSKCPRAKARVCANWHSKNAEWHFWVPSPLLSSSPFWNPFLRFF